MTGDVRHPRAFAVFRAGLYLLAGTLVLLVALSGLAAIGVIAVLGGLAVVTAGDVNLLTLLGLSGLVVLAVTVGAFGLRYGARRVEAAVRAADAVPNPLDVVKDEYVGDRIDERELEIRLASVLDEGRASGTATPGHDSGETDRPATVEEPAT
ncbi:hypothetical protein [Halomarina oriensis]|uniref:SHOCT domain-containing protein n=1 Tax=Halomarina oriensis TaxID=671145 RepID=A0A6B0GF80_9EURY|nr:hypothetical protein [Halomarina oriensis]MWG33616.1 hypothetical protein [Halomarina oriensis]